MGVEKLLLLRPLESVQVLSPLQPMSTCFTPLLPTAAVGSKAHVCAEGQVPRLVCADD